jgi:hypothetical protein
VEKDDPENKTLKKDSNVAENRADLSKLFIPNKRRLWRKSANHGFQFFLNFT